MNKYRKIIILVGLFFMLILGVFIIYGYLTEKPKIIGSSPKNNSIDNNIDISINIKFNIPQELSKDDLKIEPNIKGRWTFLGNKEANFQPEESLSVLTDYKIITTIKNRVGKKFTETIFFKTKFLYFKDLPKDLLEKEMENVDACEEGRKSKENKNCDYPN